MPVIERMSGKVLLRSLEGCLKGGWAILTGNELYIYKNRTSYEHSKMFVLLNASIVGTPNDETQDHKIGLGEYVKGVY